MICGCSAIIASDRDDDGTSVESAVGGACYTAPVPVEARIDDVVQAGDWNALVIAVLLKLAELLATPRSL